MKKNAILIAFASILATTAADWSLASGTNSMLRAGTTSPEDQDDNDTTWYEGEIRQIDREASRLTLRSPDGTVVRILQVADEGLLDAARQGAQVRYRVESDKGKPRIVTLERLSSHA